MTNNNQNEYVCVGLFSGAGGLDIGFAKYFPVKLAIELDEAACSTYKHNNPETIVWNRDIRNVSGKDILQVVGDKKIIVLGGPPCNSWSIYKEDIQGSKKGLDDDRGTLIYEYLRICEELKPHALVFENVSYMVKDRHKRSFDEFKQKLYQRTGLSLQHEILNALDYGVAQRRERVIMMGVKGNENPFNHLQKVDGPKTLQEAIKDCPPSPYFHFKNTDQKIMSKIGPGQCWNSLSPSEAFQALGREYRGICNDCGHSFKGKLSCPRCHSANIKNGYGITSYYRRLSLNKPSYTICTVSTAKPWGSLGHPIEKNRGLSVRECARLQGFPDHYEFKGSIFDQQRAIGNAVAVPLAAALAKALYQVLPKGNSNNDNQDNQQRMKVLFQMIAEHPNRSLLSQLERDLMNMAFKKFKAHHRFPDKYEVYFRETVKKLVHESKKKRIS